MTTRPVRGAAPVLRATAYATVPVPVPLGAEVTAIHSTVLEALHPQDCGAVTLKAPVPGSFENAADAGETTKVHACAPSCRTATAWPAMVSVAARESGAVLALSATVTAPFPVPDTPPVIVIHPRS